MTTQSSPVENRRRPLVRVINGRRIEVPTALETELLDVEEWLAELDACGKAGEQIEVSAAELGRCIDVVGAVYRSAEAESCE